MTSTSGTEDLNRRFGIPGVASVVPGNGGLPKLRIETEAGTAELYLHGAQLTSWKPDGDSEAIFLSADSRWEDGKAVRGGIPVCFPWFRGKADDPKAPAHGFVRTKEWQIESVVRQSGGVVATLVTVSDDSTRSWWPHDFELRHRLTIGRELKLELEFRNTGKATARFEEAQHTYYLVGDAHKARVSGLDGTFYLDNMDGNRRKQQQGDVAISKQTDNAYLNTQGSLEILDPALGRQIRITKRGSESTVVWNPWSDGASKLSDLGNDEWQRMLCVEASNVLSCAVEVAPGAVHTMTTIIEVIDDPA